MADCSPGCELWDVRGEGVLGVLSLPEIVRKMKRAGGLLGPGNAKPECGTEQWGEQLVPGFEGLFQKPKVTSTNAGKL